MPDADETETAEVDDQTTEVQNTDTPTEGNPDGDTFPRSYVEEIRTEAKDHRKRAETAEAERDALAARLHTELVRATGLLADPTDLPFDPEHLGDADTLTAAITALTEAKPHLRARKPAGSVGQGVKGDTAPEFSLLNSLKGIA